MSATAETPLVVIKVNHPEVDEIHVYQEIYDDGNRAWKIDGKIGGAPFWPLDQLQDRFDSIFCILDSYVDDTSVWQISPDMHVLSPWQALKALTRY